MSEMNESPKTEIAECETCGGLLGVFSYAEVRDALGRVIPVQNFAVTIRFTTSDPLTREQAEQIVDLRLKYTRRNALKFMKEKGFIR